MSKNIVICLDGTGNQIEENLSSVLKSYRTLPQRSEQLVYYDQGIGTLGQQSTWGAISQKVKAVWGLATGHGLDKKVLGAYQFLVENYQEDDKVYIFGFSRGAHTARVLAAFIYVMGLLRTQQANLAGSALTLYKRARDTKGIEGADHFRRIARMQTIAVEFVGVWDTVSSMIVPRPDRFYLPSLEKLPFTQENPGVRTFCHVMAIDEKRRMFRLDSWKEGQEFRPNKYSQGERVAQNLKQVWFAGCHSDVGGGFKRDDSAMGQFPLIWMIEEAMASGLSVNTRMLDHVGRGKPYNAQSKHNYPEPDHKGRLHNSMTPAWAWMEFVPKRSKHKEWPGRKSVLGFYLPLSEPRLIPEGANIHQSVVDRLSDVLNYKPNNMPSHFIPIQ
ncbi:MAG: DUF2235 domain-containing protein [Alphaproteobacteria bacterium]|nr:DUF2235 domain-containing protein [Alphaproteobacteria bacterium]